uniref:Secreted protein n=1 Tax=Globodera rostochiensis TaxID=31243 RepID=A0A914HLF0_GLORO
MTLFTLAFVVCALWGTAQSCVHNGITYGNGDEWLERSAFIMRCTINANGSWRTEVVACTIPDGRRVPINTALEDRSDEWRCKMDPSGMVTLVQGANPNARCDGRLVGSIWQEKSFELECRPGGYRRLLACISEDGQRVPVNGSRVVNGFTMVCQQFGNGTVIFHGSKTVRPVAEPIYNRRIGEQQPNYYGQQNVAGVVQCNDEMGIPQSVGSYWTENHRFNKTCRPNGAVEVVNCVSKDGYQIPVNSQVVRAGAKYSCEMTPQGIIRFTAGPADE